MSPVAQENRPDVIPPDHELPEEPPDFGLPEAALDHRSDIAADHAPEWVFLA
jgi:hypothetical protein